MMTQLKKLCALDGVSGREDAVRAYILEQLETLPTEKSVIVDALGNVIVSVKGKQRAAKKLMLAAHMDEVGLILTGVTEEGFFRFSPVGGMDAAVLYGRRVRVNGHIGVVGGKAVHQCSADEKKAAVSMDKLLVDLGAESRDEALTLARPGDVAAFDSEYMKMEGDLFKAKALDDRAGCALLLDLLKEEPPYDITVVFTVQEEVGLRGAKTAAFTVQPDVAVVIDSTTAADTVGVPEEKQVCCVGCGPVVSFMDKRTLYDRELYTRIMNTAEHSGISAQTKTMVSGGNDAGAIQLSRSGVRVAAVSLPCRYIHSPSCVLSKKDLDATAKLLHKLIIELPAE